jgi:valyl-tRNA synthetase
MICTFGDLTDVIWWRELQLPTRAIIGRDGRIITDAPEDIGSEAGLAAYDAIAGLTVKQAQTAVVEQLRASGEMLGEPRPITHPVKFFEKGDRPLEIVTSRQWYIRNGGRDQALRTALLERGQDLVWHPEHMRHRYENWVEGLNGDWLISRQRYFGVPVPVWYALDADGEIVHDTPLVPAEADLPIDPSTDVPAGYTADQRDQAGGFTGDPDVMDTWATSSLTPQIAGLWGTDDDLFARVYPMDVRPQAHDIIRTWLFSTVVRSHFEAGDVPWRHAALSGWILDPDRKKMSKSKGNVVTPMSLFDQYGSDAVRYWAASARPGVDTAFSEDQMKVGRKLATKLLNVTKFTLGFGEVDASVRASDPVDLSMLAKLADVVTDATNAFEAFDYARALERTEAFFWWFCDDYVELVKGRAYRPDDDAGATSARAALRLALSAVQRLLAPFLPFATEEVWSWWHPDSVHRAPWPTIGELGTTGDAALLDPVCEVMARVRRTKTEAKVSQRAGVTSVTVEIDDTGVFAVVAGTDDLKEAGSIADVSVVARPGELAVTVVLAPVEA